MRISLFNKFASRGRPLIIASQNFAADRGGNFGILTALLVVFLAAAAGGSVDFGRAYVLRADLQERLDAAVLAGAKVAQSQQISEAQTYFKGGISSLAAYSPSATFAINSDGTISGDVTASLPASLLGVVGVNQVPVAVHAAATAASSDPVSNGAPCILLLDTGQNALYVNSGAGIQKTSCEMHVHSAAYPAATFTDGGNGLKLARICIKGTQISYNNQLNPAVEKNCAAADDPFAGKLPAVSSLGCDQQLGGHLPDNKAVDKLTPGIYCNGLSANGSPRIELAPGLYVIKNGDWFFNSGTTLVGDDVTLYFADTSKIFFNGNVNIDLSAPADGKYKDILIFEQAGLQKTDMLFNGNQNAVLNGIIYLPSRNAHFNSTFAMNNERTAIVLDDLSLDGTNWNLTPLSGTGGSSASSGSASPRLVQ
ncbi:TadE/TadG family type IV pilus assembly protein [Rhizobium paranaense]|uniref:TadE/TadG family type IV pilus assembly protein n=1 Tax=Rhizobium paranaense TaxID=1650438 RepID=UPI0024845977|nr:TadE/TadG family type IV pilus assembly protein [Rhizobium paranaense]